jgi:hypothetical protein
MEQMMERLLAEMKAIQGKLDMMEAHHKEMMAIMKARVVNPAEMVVAKEQLGKQHVSIAIVAHATMEVPLGMAFFMWSALTATSPNYRAIARRSVFCEVRPETI